MITRIRSKSLSGPEQIQLQVLIRDISLGGVFIETRVPFEVGRLVEFQFSVPGVSTLVSARGMVRWTNDGSERDSPVGMGIEFLELRTSSGDEITDLGLPRESEDQSSG